ncbi:2'-5'-oligoadenylate synthase-like protein 2 [Sarcophilus harrisii]|uniref:Ubiquitin-like domain-containing protein n=1 Tax=Sarcophilus harrisii TaxID=9305 RepID=G3WNF4_SARHA|nr:2'-5'-oligoadenylate synthase-like protein 2 [Sarcophilus harrisii]
MAKMEDLYNTPAEKLDAFVDHVLQPNKEWKDEVKDVFKRIADFFQNQCFQDYIIRDKQVKVIKVVKGGSFSKGTGIKNVSDVDVLLFLSCFSSFEDQYRLRNEIIEFMREKLKKCQESIAYDIVTVPKQETLFRPPRSLNFDVQSKKRTKLIHVDVLPVYNALEEENPLSLYQTLRQENCPEVVQALSVWQNPQSTVYEKLIKSRRCPGEFAPSFSELQRNFVKHRPTKLKSFLRLVKYWYREYVKKKYSGKHIPPKYALELLTIYVWEIGKPNTNDFSLAEGFVTLMNLVKDYRNICIYWTVYYDFENQAVGHFLKRQLRYIPQTKEKKRPIILDPADPTNKVGNGYNWDLIAKEASYCLSQACSQLKDRMPISSWNVKGARNICVTVICPGLRTWEYCLNPYDPIQKIKKEIEKVEKIPIADQRLSFKEPKRKRQVLMGHSNLAEYDIFYKIKIEVLVISSARHHIHVKFPDNTCQTYPLERRDTVLMVKQQIEEQGKHPVKNQILRFQDQFLRQRKTLRYFDIQDGDTLELKLSTASKRGKLKTRKEKVVLARV